MSQIIFITKSLDIKCITENFLDTSSRAFEYGLVGMLNKENDLRIIHLGSKNIKMEKIKEFNFCSINYKSIFGFFRLAKEIYANRNLSDLKILTTGYYPIEIGVVIILSRIFGFKSFGYVYDTHRQVTVKMPLVKRILANIYFCFGFYWVKKSSGLFVLNDSFIKKDLIDTPYLKTKIGVNYWSNWPESDQVKSAYFLNRDKKIIVFAGTINSENGVSLLIDFVKNNKNIEFELQFYGSGEDVSNVQELSKVDARVKYFGRISEELLQERLAAADFLINLRDPAGVSIDYSFPSKLINFMSTGTPVISNIFPGLDDCYLNYLYLIDGYNIQSVSEKIIFLLKNNLDRDFGISAKKFVIKKNNWNVISEQLIEFMDKV